MERNVTVLGAGLIGSYMAKTLSASGVKTRSVDISAPQLQKLEQTHPHIETVEADLSDSAAIQQWTQDADVVIGAVPGFLGYTTLETLIRSRKNVVDISFMPEDPKPLHELAQQNNCRVAVDIGLSPGLNNLFAGYACSKAKFDSGVMYVGGLPKVRAHPYQYQLVFSARDVIEEYTRPARYLENGTLVTREALSDVEHLHFPEVGTLEAFNSDGLRTLLYTSEIPTLKEKTLRYPGHADQMRTLRQAGFFDETPIRLKGKDVIPVDATCEILKRAWKPLGEGHDIALLEVRLEGQTTKAHFQLRDEFNETENASAMSRTTGLPCIAMTRSLLENPEALPPGVHPPEVFGKNETLFHAIVNTLKEHHVHIEYSIDVI